MGQKSSVFAGAIVLLVLSSSNNVSARLFECSQAELPHLVATLMKGDSVFVDSFSQCGKPPPATIVLEDIYSDALSELRVEDEAERCHGGTWKGIYT